MRRRLTILLGLQAVVAVLAAPALAADVDDMVAELELRGYFIERVASAQANAELREATPADAEAELREAISLASADSKLEELKAELGLES